MTDQWRAEVPQLYASAVAVTDIGKHKEFAGRPRLLCIPPFVLRMARLIVP